jgi:hypothetical protein
MENNFPDIPEELLLALERHFAHPVRPLNCPLSRLFADIGRQEVIGFLRAHFITQNRKEDEDDVHV